MARARTSDVPGRQQRRVGAINDFGDAAHVGRQQRHRGGGRFQHNVGHALGAGWDNEAAAQRERCPRRHGAREVDEAVQT